MQGVVATAGIVFGFGFFAGFIWRKDTFFHRLLGLFLLFIALFLISRVHEETLLATGLAVGFILGRFKGLATGTVYFLGRVFSFIDRLAPERNGLTPDEEEILRQWREHKKNEEYRRQAEFKRHQREQEEAEWRAKQEEHERWKRERSGQKKQEKARSDESGKQEYHRQHREERARSEEKNSHREQADSSKNEQKRQKQSFGSKQDYMKVLGLSPGFTRKELKTAYRRKSSEFHPDKHENKPEAVRKKMEEMQKMINEAYEHLK